MEKRKFGRSNEAVSALGMGTYYDVMDTAALGKAVPGRAEKAEGIRKGIELGMNLIDTAEVYMTEQLVGEAIKGFRRDDLFVATKVWSSRLRHDDVLKAALRSLDRLGCEYIDLYQVQWPNPGVPVGETMRAMERLVSEGKVRYIGVSNFGPKQVQEADEALSKSEIVSDQVEYSLRCRDPEAELLPYCERGNIAVVAYCPLARGELARPAGRLGECVGKLAGKYGKTPAQVSLNWLIGRSGLVFPIPRVSRPERAVENAEAAGWSLTQDEALLLGRC